MSPQQSETGCAVGEVGAGGQSGLSAPGHSQLHILQVHCQSHRNPSAWSSRVSHQPLPAAHFKSSHVRPGVGLRLLPTRATQPYHGTRPNSLFTVSGSSTSFSPVGRVSQTVPVIRPHLQLEQAEPSSGLLLTSPGGKPVVPGADVTAGRMRYTALIASISTPQA